MFYGKLPRSVVINCKFVSFNKSTKHLIELLHRFTARPYIWLVEEKLSRWSPVRANSNRAVQPQEIANDLKLHVFI